MRRGWFGERYRHYLAAKNVRTGRKGWASRYLDLNQQARQERMGVRGMQVEGQAMSARVAQYARPASKKEEDVVKSREPEFTIPKRMPPLSWEDERILSGGVMRRSVPVRRIVVEKEVPVEPEKQVIIEPLRLKIPIRDAAMADVRALREEEREDKKYGSRHGLKSEILGGGA